MNRLFVDVGNSRVKYASSDGVMTALAHDGDPPRALARMLQVVERPDEIVLVDVTGSAAGALDGYAVRTLTSNAVCCGVTSAYAEPARLGADRWAALIGAHAHYRGGVCVVDAGSAITVDTLSAEGVHLGGWIAPGLALSVNALANGTRFARSTGDSRPGGGFADNTADAIQAGVRNAALGLVARARRTAEALLGKPPQLVFCGGDAATLASEVPGAIVDEPLVLRGLMAWVAVA